MDLCCFNRGSTMWIEIPVEVTTHTCRAIGDILLCETFMTMTIMSLTLMTPSGTGVGYIVIPK